MSEDLEIADTERAVGQLLPVLVNAKGEVVDGRHRLKVNRNWKKVTIDLNDLQTHVARLVINTQRRIADEEDYNELARFLQKAEPGDKAYRVSLGKSIAERISELTGISNRIVLANLDERYKQNQEKVADAASLGIGKSLRVPKPVAKSVKDAVTALKEAVEENPDKTKEILEGFKDAQDLAVAMAKTRSKNRTKEKTEKRPPDAGSFIKSICRWAKAALAVDEIPETILAKVIADMDAERRKRVRLSIAIILRNTEKLKAALEEASA